MKTITLQLYKFKELSREAKEKALTKFRYLNVDFDWWNDEFEDFTRLCSYLGIAVAKDSIKFSGFYSQGDGSGFAAIVDIPKLDEAVRTKAWKVYAPLQEFPFIPAPIDHKIMALVKNSILSNEPQIISRQRQFGIAVDLGIYVVNENGREHDNVFDELEKLEAWLRSIATALNVHLYQSLEKQYEFLPVIQLYRKA